MFFCILGGIRNGVRFEFLVVYVLFLLYIFMGYMVNKGNCFFVCCECLDFLVFEFVFVSFIYF